MNMSEREPLGAPLRQVPAPDLWARIEDGLREPARRGPGGDPPGGSGRRQRVFAAAIAFVVVAGGIAFAWAALGPGSRHATLRPPPPTSPAPLPSAPAQTVAASFKGAAARCEATLTTPVVRPGQTPAVTYRLTNQGSTPIRYGTYQDYIEVKGAHGDTVSSWQDRFGGIIPSMPAPFAGRTLGGGRAVTYQGVYEPVVRWEGPLSIHLTCPFVIQQRIGHEVQSLQSPTLPPLALQVFARGQAPSVGTAVERAVAATQRLFEACHPRPDGSAVVGEITPPKVSKPWKVQPDPMPARCWAQIERHPGFAVVTLWFVTPADAPTPTPSGPAGTIRLPPLPTAEVFRWTFVVTPWSTVSALSHADGKSPMATVGYNFEKGHWMMADASCRPSAAPEFYLGSDPEFPVSKNPC